MDKNDKSLVYDPYTKQYFYLSNEELHKRLHELSDIYSEYTFSMLTEDGRPCLGLRLKEEEE